MLDDLSLTHEQQQQAVEKIQTLMSQGISTAEAIKIVSAEIREQANAQESDSLKQNKSY